MEPTPDDRGQANLVGFILVFGFLLISYSLFQAYVIPNHNAEIEYQHYQETRSDMTGLYAEIISESASNSPVQVFVPIDLGTDYPPRLLFLNPPPAAGSLQSTGSGTIQIDGGNAANICGRNQTTGLVYSPGYHVTTQPDIRYDNGLLYVETASGEYAMLESTNFVTNESGSSPTIHLYRLSGELRMQSGTNTLPLEITRIDSRTTSDVPVTNITLRSDLQATEWNENGVLEAPNEILSATQTSDSRVRIHGFEGSYDIKCHSVGLGQQS